MAINSKQSLADYILRQLGAPLVSVEVTEDQINDIIDMTVQEFSNFALEGELTKYIQMTVSAPCEITMDGNVNNILKVSRGGGTMFAGYGGVGFVIDYVSLISGGINLNDAVASVINLSATRSMLDKYFGDDLSFTWNPYKKKINISETFHGNILMEVTTEYTPDTIDMIFDNSWVKRMSTARVKLLQSDITGKYDQNLVGGARINHEKMQSRAEQEIEVLREELITKWGGPAPISIG